MMITDNEFDDLNEVAVAPVAPVAPADGKKKTVKKKAVKKAVKSPPEYRGGTVIHKEESGKVFDIQFANAVKVGIHQKNYFSNDVFDITLRGNVIELRVKLSEPNKPSVFTTLYNVIHWRMEEA